MWCDPIPGGLAPSTAVPNRNHDLRDSYARTQNCSLRRKRPFYILCEEAERSVSKDTGTTRREDLFVPAGRSPSGSD